MFFEDQFPVGALRLLFGEKVQQLIIIDLKALDSDLDVCQLCWSYLLFDYYCWFSVEDLFFIKGIFLVNLACYCWDSSHKVCWSIKKSLFGFQEKLDCVWQDPWLDIVPHYCEALSGIGYSIGKNERVFTLIKELLYRGQNAVRENLLLSWLLVEDLWE